MRGKVAEVIWSDNSSFPSGNDEGYTPTRLLPLLCASILQGLTKMPKLVYIIPFIIATWK